MTDEEIKLKRLRYAIEEDMTENELFEIARERRYRINDLERENVELKKETKRLSAVYEMNELLLKHQNSLKKEVHDLRKENAELKEQVEDWKADHEHNLELMKGLNGKIAELKAQIEKMKNCQNCKHNYYSVCISEIRCENLEQWELAE